MLGDEICKDTNQLSTILFFKINLVQFEKHHAGFRKIFRKLFKAMSHERNSFDQGSWSTKIFDVQDTGRFDGFNDERINWLLDAWGVEKNFSDHWKELTHICSKEPAEIFFQ